MLILELLTQGLMTGALYGIAGLGFALIFQAARELHFAYGATIAVAGYVVYASVETGLGLIVGLFLAIIIASAIGAASRYFFYRPLNDHFAVLLFSFGLTIVIENALQAFFGPQSKVLAPGVLNQVITLVPGTHIQARIIDLVGVGLLILAAIALRVLLKRTRTGLAMNAVMRDHQMAELVGVRSERIKVLAYVIGSILAALAGAVNVVGSGVSPMMGFELLLFCFILTILAGNNLPAVAAWGLAIGMAQAAVSAIMPAHFGELAIFGILLVYLIIKNLRTPMWVTS